MPIQELLLQAKGVAIDLAPPTAIAAAFAAIIFLFFGLPWRATRLRRTAVGGVLGVGAGFFAGCWWLGVRPHWPPREDQDRLLLVLFPAVIAVELVAALLKSEKSEIKNSEIRPADVGISDFGFRFSKLYRCSPWVLRLVIAAAAGLVLLHNSSYITDLSGPGTRQWSSEQTGLIFVGLAVALAGTWILLDWLARLEPGRAVPLAVAVASAGTGLVMMMSGYASGGPLAMPLVGAVIGVLIASLALGGNVNLTGILGFAVVGLFALLVIGHFFGDLTWTNAALLFFAPALGVVPELPPFRRINSKVRTSVGVILTTIPVLIAIGLAQQKMTQESSQPTSGDSQEPTLDDYMNFGK